jgi:hypothetical protein
MGFRYSQGGEGFALNLFFSSLFPFSLSQAFLVSEPDCGSIFFYFYFCQARPRNSSSSLHLLSSSSSSPSPSLPGEHTHLFASICSHRRCRSPSPAARHPTQIRKIPNRYPIFLASSPPRCQQKKKILPIPRPPTILLFSPFPFFFQHARRHCRTLLDQHVRQGEQGLRQGA